MIRKLKDDDIPILKSFCKDFKLPDVKSPLVVISGVVENDGIIGYGQVKLTSEVFVILDPNRSKLDRVHALDELFIVGKSMSEKSGISEWLAFVKQNPRFSKSLIKRFGFNKVKEDCLQLRLE